MAMKANVHVSSGQGIERKLRQLKERLATGKEAAIGLPADAGTHPDAGMSYARLGAIHEFGGTFRHPGGTRYVIGNDGKARFVSNSYMGPVSGITQPHNITIPERSFLRVPLRSAQAELAAGFREMMPLVAKGEMTMDQALNAIGAKAAGISQEAISAGIPPANSAETARRKGSSKPLVDSGALRQAITWVVRDRGL